MPKGREIKMISNKQVIKILIVVLILVFMLGIIAVESAGKPANIERQNLKTQIEDAKRQAAKTLLNWEATREANE